MSMEALSCDRQHDAPSMSQAMSVTPSRTATDTAALNGADSEPLSGRNDDQPAAQQTAESDSRAATPSSVAKPVARRSETPKRRGPPPAVPPRVGSAVRASAPPAATTTSSSRSPSAEPVPSAGTTPVTHAVRHSTGSAGPPAPPPKFVPYHREASAPAASTPADKRAPLFVPYNQDDCTKRSLKFVPLNSRAPAQTFGPVKHSPVLSPKFLPSPVLRQKFEPPPPPPKTLPSPVLSPVLSPKFTPYKSAALLDSSGSFRWIDDDSSGDSVNGRSKSSASSLGTAGEQPKEDPGRAEAADVPKEGSRRVEGADIAKEDSRRVEGADVAKEDSRRVEGADVAKEDSRRIEAADVAKEAEPRVKSLGQIDQWSPEINIAPTAPVCVEVFQPENIPSPMVVDNAFRTSIVTAPAPTRFNYENVDVQPIVKRGRSEFTPPDVVTYESSPGVTKRPFTVANIDMSLIVAGTVDADISSAELKSPDDNKKQDFPDSAAPMPKQAARSTYENVTVNNGKPVMPASERVAPIAATETDSEQTDVDSTTTDTASPPLLRVARGQTYENVTINSDKPNSCRLADVSAESLGEKSSAKDTATAAREAPRQCYENVTVDTRLLRPKVIADVETEPASDEATRRDTAPPMVRPPQRQSYENVTVNKRNTVARVQVTTPPSSEVTLSGEKTTTSSGVAPPVLAPHRKQDSTTADHVTRSPASARHRVISVKKPAAAGAGVTMNATDTYAKVAPRGDPARTGRGFSPASSAPAMVEPFRPLKQRTDDRTTNAYSGRPSNTGRATRTGDDTRERPAAAAAAGRESLADPASLVIGGPARRGPPVNGLALKSPSNSRRRFVVETELPPSRAASVAAEASGGRQQRSVTPTDRDAESDDSYMSNSDFDDDELSSFSDDNFTGCMLSSPIEASRVTEPSYPGRDALYDTVVELLHTERSYVDRLHFLCRVVLLNLKILDKVQDVHSLGETTVDELFVNVEVIFNFHACNLLPRIEERVRLWQQNKSIGDILKELVPFLVIYTNFVEHFHKCMKLMDWHRHNHSVYAALIEEVEKLPECRRLTVQQHMLHIAHRVAKYQSFLKDYFDNLPDDSNDKNDVREALDSVTKTAYKLERSMGKEERLAALKKMQRCLDTTTNFVSSSRELVKYGKIKLIAPKSGRRRERYAFLLNDMLLLCISSAGGHKHKLRYNLDVDGMQIYEGDNLQTPNTFYIHSKRTTVELHCSSLVEMRDWKRAIREVIDEFTKLKLSDTLTVNYELHADEVGVCRPKTKPSVLTSCFLCDCAFKMTRRKHRCRACAQFVCSTCYTQKAPLEFDNLQQHKVCDECYVIIRQRELKLGAISWEVDAVAATNPGILSGTLQMSPDTGKSWTKRWFVIHGNGVLYSFKNNQDPEPYTTLPIKRFSVTITNKDDAFHKSNAFKLSNLKRAYFFQAVDSGVTLSWLKVLADFSCSHA